MIKEEVEDIVTIQKMAVQKCRNSPSIKAVEKELRVTAKTLRKWVKDDNDLCTVKETASIQYSGS